MFVIEWVNLKYSETLAYQSLANTFLESIILNEYRFTLAGKRKIFGVTKWFLATTT